MQISTMKNIVIIFLYTFKFLISINIKPFLLNEYIYYISGKNNLYLMNI